MNCPNCHEAVDEFDHLHNTAHGIPGTHMAGSERFHCPECGVALTREQATALGLKYEIDK